MTSWSRHDHVTIYFGIAHATIWTIIFKTCGRNKLYLLYFSHIERCKIGQKCGGLCIYLSRYSLIVYI